MLFFLLLHFYTSAQEPLEPLPPVDSLSDWQVNALIQKYAIAANNLDTLLSEKSKTKSELRSLLEAAYALSKLNDTVPQSDRDFISRLAKTAKKEEKAAKGALQQAAKTEALAAELTEADNEQKRKQLPKLWKQLEKANAMAHHVAALEELPPAGKEPQTPQAKKPKKEKAPPQELPSEAPEESTVSTPAPPPPPKPQPATVRTKKYDPAQDVMMNPPSLQCRLVVDTRDELSGERYRRTAPVELFRHSPAALKNYLQGKPNVQCAAALASSGVNVYLHLIFTINDPNPRKAFGKIEKESLATLKFIDGSSYNIYNQQTSEGIQNPDTQAFIYQAQYLLPADALKKIRRSELDKIRIAWSSGYEDYEVQYVVLLMQQAKCLFDN